MTDLIAIHRQQEEDDRHYGDKTAETHDSIRFWRCRYDRRMLLETIDKLEEANCNLIRASVLDSAEKGRLQSHLATLETLLRESKRGHEVDRTKICDLIYNATRHMVNSNEGCTCGADEWNAKVEAALGKEGK